MAPARTSYIRNRRRRLVAVTAVLLLEQQRTGAATEVPEGASGFHYDEKGEMSAAGTGGMRAYIRKNLQQMLLSKLKI